MNTYVNPLKKRSSIAASLLAGFVGWTAVVFIGPLAFGFMEPVETLFSIAFSMALAQILLLRLLFFLLQMHKSTFTGVFWGLASGISLYFLAKFFFPEMAENEKYWFIIFGFTGASEGGFISYYYIDDARIQKKNKKAVAKDMYGRDAHWYEPFGFGAISFLIAFLPSMNLNLLVFAIIAGAMNGIISAGVSHFSSDKLKRNVITLTLIIFIAGSIQGAISGLLFRSFSDNLPMHFILHGIIGGILTYAITFLRGRKLAEIENKKP